jgi:hypothetical protein
MMLYYLFGEDLGWVNEQLEKLAGIDSVLVHNNNGILPDTYLQIGTEVYTDLGLFRMIQDAIGKQRKYIILKSLHGKEPII